MRATCCWRSTTRPWPRRTPTCACPRICRLCRSAAGWSSSAPARRPPPWRWRPRRTIASRGARPRRRLHDGAARHRRRRLPAEPPERRSASSPARHPTPDEAQPAGGGARRWRWCARRRADDLVLVLLSGGASALWAAPAAGLDLAGKTALTRGLLKSGADIHEMNLVRRHVSRIKGGRLQEGDGGADAHARHLRRAGRRPRHHRLRPDGCRCHHARRGARRARPPSAAHAGSGSRACRRPWRRSSPIPPTRRRSRTIRPSPAPSTASSPRRRARLQPRRETASAPGYDVVDLGDALPGEAREVAQAHAELAREAQRGRPQGRRS